MTTDTYRPPPTEPRPAWRYNNRDIEADYDRLHEIAVRFLARYTGRFDPLRAAKNVLFDGDMLSIDQLRIVCNCMIQDFSVIGMPEPVGDQMVFDASEVPSSFGRVDVTIPRQKKKSRPAIIRTQARIRLPFWYSTLPRAEVIHVAESATLLYHTEVYYHPDRWYSVMPPFAERFELNMRALCKEWYRMPKGMCGAGADKVVELLFIGRRMCPACIRHRHADQLLLDEIDEALRLKSGE